MVREAEDAAVGKFLREMLERGVDLKYADLLPMLDEVRKSGQSDGRAEILAAIRKRSFGEWAHEPIPDGYSYLSNVADNLYLWLSERRYKDE